MDNVTTENRRRIDIISDDEFLTGLGDLHIDELRRRRELADAQGQLRRLDHWAELGSHLTRPWRVVVAGPPNVGKSSLVNAILGYQRAIVIGQPGTTRDVLSAPIALASGEVMLLDAAGLDPHDAPVDPRDATDLGALARTLSHRSLIAADLILLVVDVTDEPEATVTTWRETFPGRPAHVPSRRVGCPSTVRSSACARS